MSAEKTISPPPQPDPLTPVLLPANESSMPHVIDPANVISAAPATIQPVSMSHTAVSGKVPGKLASQFSDDERQILRLAAKIAGGIAIVTAILLFVYIEF